MSALTLRPVNADVYGAHVGNLKHVGAVWKFSTTPRWPRRMRRN